MKNILVIDDEHAVRLSFELTFEDSNYTLITANTGREGLKVLHEKNIDLVFLDLKMPDLNGAQVLEQIRTFDTELPVYIITAFHIEFMTELHKITEKRLNFELLHKPVNSNALRELAGRILN